MVRRVRPPRLLIFFPALLILASGCGGGSTDRGAVGGMVKLDGKPIEKGTILFTPIQGARGSVAGGQIENGQYQIPAANGPALGWNRVEIQAMRNTGRMVQKPFSPPGTMGPEQTEAVAPQFNTQSTLKTEIKSGDNTADFNVSSK
jgi:hypothetical protein